MICYTVFYPDGTKRLLPPPVTARLDCDDCAPADAFEGVFPLESLWGTLTRIRLDCDGCVLFDGIVDEQTQKSGQDGGALRLTARSRAALLLDNEAEPRTFFRPSFGDLFRCCAQPYGFADCPNDSRVFEKAYRVEKGISEWQALENFCKIYLKTGLYVKDDQLVVGKRRTKENHNIGLGGIPCNTLTVTSAHCRRLSEIYVQEPHFLGYGKNVGDAEARLLGIRRRRFYKREDNGPAPEVLLQKARESAFSILAVCAGPPHVFLGDNVTVRDPLLGSFPGLLVKRCEYLLGPGGEFCRLTLRRED